MDIVWSFFSVLGVVLVISLISIVLAKIINRLPGKGGPIGRAYL